MAAARAAISESARRYSCGNTFTKRERAASQSSSIASATVEPVKRRCFSTSSRSVASSERSAGRPYREAASWREGELPGEVADLTVVACEPARVKSKIVFSALDSSVAGDVEKAFARGRVKSLPDKTLHSVSIAAARKMMTSDQLKAFDVGEARLDLIQQLGSHPFVAMPDVIRDELPVQQERDRLASHRLRRQPRSMLEAARRAHRVNAPEEAADPLAVILGA